MLQIRKWGAGAVLILAVFAVFAGFRREAGQQEIETENRTKTEVQNHTEVQAGTGSGDETEEQKSPEPEIPLDAEETQMFSELHAAMAMGECSEAARILNDMEAEWENITAETLGGTIWFYQESVTEDGKTVRTMEPVSGKTEGTGLVVTRYNTAFYGSFLGGMPEGTCLALQAMVLDEPRYTFAEGEWKEGKMNGEGRTGYCYYANAPESGFVMTEKEGNYQDDLLEGPFVYRTESGGGETFTWKMEASGGVIVLTDSWNYSSYLKEYTLSSEEDSQRSYVLSEDRAKSVMWNNLIYWTGVRE